jgi:hypothetical protein
MQELQVLVV